MSRAMRRDPDFGDPGLSDVRPWTMGGRRAVPTVGGVTRKSTIRHAPAPERWRCGFEERAEKGSSMSRPERLHVVADAFDSGLNVRQRHGRVFDGMLNVAQHFGDCHEPNQQDESFERHLQSLHQTHAVSLIAKICTAGLKKWLPAAVFSPLVTVAGSSRCADALLSSRSQTGWASNRRSRTRL